jgi:hypothetical protein
MYGAEPGETRRIVCPFCSAKHEKSFAMTRGTAKPHLLLFRCYRGSCDQHGYVVDKEGAGMVLKAGERTDEATQPLAVHDHCTSMFMLAVAGRYNMSTEYLRAQGVRHGCGDALCMPWRAEDGRQVGWVEKRFDKAWHKSHHDLNDRTAPRLAFPRIARSYSAMPPSAVCVLVESLVDAYRINEYATLTGAELCAVALLGADLSGRDALRLSQLFRHIMVCLDPDQWPKGSMRVVDRFAGMPSLVRATTMSLDPKDVADWELEELFDRCREMTHA